MRRRRDPEMGVDGRLTRGSGVVKVLRRDESRRGDARRECHDQAEAGDPHLLILQDRRLNEDGAIPGCLRWRSSDMRRAALRGRSAAGRDRHPMSAALADAAVGRHRRDPMTERVSLAPGMDNVTADAEEVVQQAGVAEEVRPLVCNSRAGGHHWSNGIHMGAGRAPGVTGFRGSLATGSGRWRIETGSSAFVRLAAQRLRRDRLRMQYVTAGLPPWPKLAEGERRLAVRQGFEPWVQV